MKHDNISTLGCVVPLLGRTEYGPFGYRTGTKTGTTSVAAPQTARLGFAPVHTGSSQHGSESEDSCPRGGYGETDNSPSLFALLRRPGGFESPRGHATSAVLARLYVLLQAYATLRFRPLGGWALKPAPLR